MSPSIYNRSHIRTFALPRLTEALTGFGLEKGAGLNYHGEIRGQKLELRIDAISFACHLMMRYPAPLPFGFRAREWFIDSGGWPHVDDDPPPPHDKNRHVLVHKGFLGLGVAISKEYEYLLEGLNDDILASLHERLRSSGPVEWQDDGIACIYEFTTLYWDSNKPLTKERLDRIEGNLVHRSLPAFKDFVQTAVLLGKTFYEHALEVLDRPVVGDLITPDI